MEKTNWYDLSLPLTTATASSWTATGTGVLVQVTSESLTTAAAWEYTLTLTNKNVKATSIIFASAWLGSSTQWTPWIGWVTVSDNTAVVTVTNLHASQAFNWTILVNVLVVNPK